MKHIYQQILSDLRHYEETGLGAFSFYEAGQIADLLEEMNHEIEKLRDRNLRLEKHMTEKVQKHRQTIKKMRLTQAALQAYKDYISALYGENYQIANWHLNGDLEPLDSFIDSAEEKYDAVLFQNGSNDGKVPNKEDEYE